VSDAQLGVVELLVDNLGELVDHAQLQAAYHDRGGSPTTTSFRSLIHRLRRRFAEVELRMHVVRTKGILLTPDDEAAPIEPAAR
jgi:DNA-binding response OmpR family regulator